MRLGTKAEAEEVRALKQLKECLAQMKAKQLSEQERKRKEHASLFGQQLLEHERRRAIQIAESIELRLVDKILQAQSVQELTETEMGAANDMSKMEVDECAFAAESNAIFYTDQKYCGVLTGSSRPSAEYRRLKSGLIDVEKGSQFTADQGLSLEEYLRKKGLVFDLEH